MKIIKMRIRGMRNLLLITCICFLSTGALLSGERPRALIKLDAATRQRCLAILRGALDMEEFWPGIHAAEALTLGGYGEEAAAALAPLLETETDDRKRCGLGRELARAGDRSKAQVMLDILAKPDPYAHVHACESLYKVNQIGDGDRLRAAFADREHPVKALMAAGALARWGNPEAFAYLREEIKSTDPNTARIAAWILARVGGESDLPELRAGAARFEDELAKAYFEHALAALGDPEGMEKLEQNLSHENIVVRSMAATFAGEAGLRHLKKPLIAMLEDEEPDARVRAAQSLLVMARARKPRPEGIIVNDVYPASETHPRYSEGDIHVLNDGRYLYATTEFIGDSSDFAKARLAARISEDGGRTWGAKRVLQENTGGMNVMSVTFQALTDKEVGLFYLRKNSPADLDVYLRVSRDDGLSFGPARPVTRLPGYHVMNNDRVIRLKSGRLLAPTASSPDVEKAGHFTSRAWISDDGGRSWRAGSGMVDYPRRGAMEPELLELKDGRVLMMIRTQLGHIAAARSSDGGDTWTEAASWGVRAPEAPATLRRIPSTGDMLLIWNDNYVEGAAPSEKRTPLTAAISRDEGKTWEHKKNLESDSEHTYAYISAAFDQGRLLLSYYVRDSSVDGRFSSRFRSAPIAWLYE